MRESGRDFLGAPSESMADTGAIDRERLAESEWGSTGSENTQSSSLACRPTRSTADSGGNNFGAMPQSNFAHPQRNAQATLRTDHRRATDSYFEGVCPARASTAR
jgi:hypothetical protein